MERLAVKAVNESKAGIGKIRMEHRKSVGTANLSIFIFSLSRIFFGDVTARYLPPNVGKANQAPWLVFTSTHAKHCASLTAQLFEVCDEILNA